MRTQFSTMATSFLFVAVWVEMLAFKLEARHGLSFVIRSEHIECLAKRLAQVCRWTSPGQAIRCRKIKERLLVGHSGARADVVQ